MALPLAVILVPAAPPAEQVKMVQPSPALVHAAAELRRRVPDTGRYVVQESERTAERTHIWAVVGWLAWATGRNSLNIYNLESSTVGDPVFEGANLHTRPAHEEIPRLRRLGLTHLLLIEPEAVGDLLADGRVAVVWQEGGMAIAEVHGADGQVSPVPMVAETVAPSPVATGPAPTARPGGAVGSAAPGLRAHR